MARKKDQEIEAVIVPLNERDPVLEEKVNFYMKTTFTLPENKIKPQRTKLIDTRDPFEQELWEREEIRRIREGHFGMSGKTYFFHNFVKIWNIEDGIIRPEFRVASNGVRTLRNGERFALNVEG